MNGISFEMRINSYFIPNRTLSSYIPGRTKEGKDSCLVRGFWGDITNSPYIGFGVELNNEEEHDFFYAHQDVNYKFHSQQITEWNLARYLTRLEKDELYELKFTDHKKTPIPENEKKTTDDNNDYKQKNEEDANNVNIENLGIEGKKEVANSTKDKFELTEENGEKMLLGFEYFDLKVYLLSGEIDQLFKKKK